MTGILEFPVPSTCTTALTFYGWYLVRPYRLMEVRKPMQRKILTNLNYRKTLLARYFIECTSALRECTSALLLLQQHWG